MHINTKELAAAFQLDGKSALNLSFIMSAANTDSLLNYIVNSPSLKMMNNSLEALAGRSALLKLDGPVIDESSRSARSESLLKAINTDAYKPALIASAVSDITGIDAEAHEFSIGEDTIHLGYTFNIPDNDGIALIYDDSLSEKFMFGNADDWRRQGIATIISHQGFIESMQDVDPLIITTAGMGVTY